MTLLHPRTLTFLKTALMLTSSLTVLSTAIKGISRGSIGGIFNSGIPLTSWGILFSNAFRIHLVYSGSDLRHNKFETRSAENCITSLEKVVICDRNLRCFLIINYGIHTQNFALRGRNNSTQHHKVFHVW